MTFLKLYGRWIAVLIVANLLTIIMFEVLRPVQLTWDGLWNARSAIWAGLLLFNNLVVLWWYAHLTQDLARSAAAQARIAQSQLEESQRPCVVVEWRPTPPPQHGMRAGWTYVARNIGRGLALNVVHVKDLDSETLDSLHLGALEAGQAIELPHELVRDLNDEKEHPLDQKRHLLISEPLAGGEWIVTENVIETSGRLSHRVRTRKLPPAQIEQIHRETAQEYIHRNWPAIRAELDQMLKELEPPK